jgi:5-carboxyvanillate decarboxylase
MKKIAVEEHFYTQEYLDYLRSRKKPPMRKLTEDANHNKIEKTWDSAFCRIRPVSSGEKALDVGAKRLEDMDSAGIDIQVLSLSNPGVELFGRREGSMMAMKTNDQLAKLIQQNPKRFAGMAAISPVEPKGAAAELERAVKQLGLKGVLINSHINGEYLDGKKYWVIFEKAIELGVPIYIHPREPAPEMVKPYSTYPALMGAMLGFGADVSLHAMRLICGGVFDQYPNLKIMLGHLGEALPFWMWRLDDHWVKTPYSKTLKKKPSEYLKENFVVTTSGMFWKPAFMCVFEAMGADSILFAVDYPYESNEFAAKFIDNVPISETDREKICHLNAEKLLALHV